MEVRCTPHAQSNAHWLLRSCALLLLWIAAETFRAGGP